jgi:hypothetical protein
MNCVNHRYVKGLARRFLGSEGTRIKGVYMILVDEYRRGGDFFVKKGS